jgi:hypothetical protein
MAITTGHAQHFGRRSRGASAARRMPYVEIPVLFEGLPSWPLLQELPFPA